MIQTHPFGKTGHDSTRVIFGAAALWGGDVDAAARTLQLLLDHGINHIDTAASYGRSERLVGTWMPEHRATFFLATKTGERTRDAAAAQFAHSLERLHVDSVDMLQLHNLVDPDEWATALGPGGALEAAQEARERGQLRFIGVTGHGTTVAEMHLRSLERFPFDSVLLPYNYAMMQNPAYRRDFEELERVCRERGVAMQTIKGMTVGPWKEPVASMPPAERPHSTWYEPFEDQRDIDLAVDYVLGRPGMFLNSAGDLDVLPRIIDAAERSSGAAPSEADMRALAGRAGMQPLFV
jgi:aryl-alcohol dehydrogenase-like predicted oxidoreductase